MATKKVVKKVVKKGDKKPAKKAVKSVKMADEVSLTGMIQNPLSIQTGSGVPIMTFTLNGLPFKVFNGKTNTVSQYFNGRTIVDVDGHLEEHAGRNGQVYREYVLDAIQPYLNV